MIAAMPPIPAEPPIGGPFWTIIVPSLLLATASVATWLLYRRFSRGQRGSRGR